MDKARLEKANQIQSELDDVQNDIAKMQEYEYCQKKYPMRVWSVALQNSDLDDVAAEINLNSYPELQESIKALVLNTLQRRKADLEAQFAAL